MRIDSEGCGAPSFLKLQVRLFESVPFSIGSVTTEVVSSGPSVQGSLIQRRGNTLAKEGQHRIVHKERTRRKAQMRDIKIQNGDCGAFICSEQYLLTVTVNAIRNHASPMRSSSTFMI